MIRRHSAKSTSSQAVKGTMAALFTRTSSLPSSATVSAIIRFTSVSEETSTPIPTPPVGRGGLGAGGVDVGHDHRPALLGQLVGDRLPDPLRGAGDDGHASVQLAHGYTS